jgi:peptide/nickel transport system permease protein
MRRTLGVFRTIGRSPKLSLGLGILIVVVVVGVLNGWLIGLIRTHIGADPMAVSPNHWVHPNGKYLLGTDQYGRDVAAMTLNGLAPSLKIGIIAGGLSTAIAIVIAFVAAYRGGLLDSFLSAITDFFLVIPTLPLLIAYSAFAKHVSLVQVGVILAVFSWPGAARQIRTQVLSLRQRSYVDLAKVTKLNTFEVIFAELAPNMLGFLALGLAYAAVASMFALIGLEVIGLGPSGVIDLGFILNLATSGGALTLGAWGVFVAPIAIASIVFFALTLINVGLEEKYNPRLRKVAGA